MAGLAWPVKAGHYSKPSTAAQPLTIVETSGTHLPYPVQKLATYCKVSAANRATQKGRALYSSTAVRADPNCHISIECSLLEPAASLPDAYWGPVCVQNIPGKGRGVLCTQRVQAGQLLMVSKPLLYTEEEEGIIPDTELLLELLNCSLFSGHQHQLLKCLYNGVQEPGPVPDFVAASADRSNTLGQVPYPVTSDELDEEAQAGLLAFNCFGEAYKDFPATWLRQEASTGHLGLWPEFAMLNHSCAPNAVNYVLGDRMLVRAAVDLPQGSEVLINYLGRSSLRPVAERQTELAEGYQFSCNCRRCQFELLQPQLSAVSQATFETTVREALPTFQQAISQPELNKEAVIATANQLEELLAVVKETWQASRTGTTDNLREHQQWVTGSSYETHSLLAACYELLGQRDDHLAALQSMSLAGRACAPASDLELYLHIKAWSLAQQLHGLGSNQEVQHQQYCVKVLKARYGAHITAEQTHRLLTYAIQAADKVFL